MASVDALHGLGGCGHCELPAANGPERLAAVQAITEANVVSDPAIDEILVLLQQLFNVPYTVVSTLRSDTVNLEQACGLTVGSAYAAPGFCFWSLVTPEPQVLFFRDTQQDARTASSPLVLQPPHLRFYAAAPLVTSNRQRIGMLCVLHTEPRAFSSEHAAVLCNFAELVMRALEGRLLQRNPASAVLGGAGGRGADAYNQATAVVDTSAPGWAVLHANEAFSALAGGSMQDGNFWDGFEAPPGKGQEAGEPQPGQCTPVRPRSKSGFSGVLQATFRPLNTYKLDDAALLVGNPSRPEPAGAAQAARARFRSLHFVLLAARPVARQKRTLPFADLRLGTTLGAGTHARVYRGTRAGKRVAVKVVAAGECLLDSDGRPLEAAIHGALEHPNIVRLLDHGMDGGAGAARLFLLLEYCDRGALVDAVDEGWFREARNPASPPCLRVVLETAGQISRAVSHLHAKGVVHGDLSGGNVLLQSVGEEDGGFTAKVTDFGLSRWQAEGAQSELNGTPSYMAPEVLRGEPPTQASDVFSVGVLLHEMLAGARAWSGMSAFQILHAVVHRGEALPPLAPGLPPGLAAAVQRCLDPDPRLRCTSAQLVRLLDAEAALLAGNGGAGGAPTACSPLPDSPPRLEGEAADAPSPRRVVPSPWAGELAPSAPL